jgi:hypothetical protein
MTISSLEVLIVLAMRSDWIVINNASACVKKGSPGKKEHVGWASQSFAAHDAMALIFLPPL